MSNVGIFLGQTTPHTERQKIDASSQLQRYLGVSAPPSRSEQSHAIDHTFFSWEEEALSLCCWGNSAAVAERWLMHKQASPRQPSR